MISVQASLKKEIYPIFAKVLCRTFKLIILFKTHFYYVLFCNSVLMGNLTEREISVRCLGLVVFLSMIGGLSKGEQCLLEMRPSASSVPLPRAGKKGNGTHARWLPLSHIDLGSEKAIYLPSRGKTGVSELQGSQQRCANATAIDTIKPRAAIYSGGKMQAMPRMGSSPSHRHSKPKGSGGLAGSWLLLAWHELCDVHCRNAYSTRQVLVKGCFQTSDTSDQSVPSPLATTSLLMGGATQKGTFNFKCSEEITGIVCPGWLKF